MSIEKDVVYLGVKLGEHSFDLENMMDEIKVRAVDAGKKFVYFRPHISLAKVSEEYILKWAKYLAENEIYFFYGNNVQYPPVSRDTQIPPETVAKIKEVAGKYFLGDAVREPGTHLTAKAPGYFHKNLYVKADGSHAYECEPTDPNSMWTDTTRIRVDLADMEDGHNFYVNALRKYASADRRGGMPNVLTVEATSITKYALEAGMDIPVLEVMNGNPDDMLPTVRGAARAYGKDFWGALIAHEWYGGFKHADMLKRKRLDVATKLVYMAGCNAILIESGDEAISSYGQKYDESSEICADYRRIFKNLGEFMKNDERPRGGPKTKFAFVFGNHEAWTGFCQSSLWNQFGKEEWGHSDAEFSWRILRELNRKRVWADNQNYGDYDLSAYPAYGMYDIVPIEAPLDVLKKYEHLVFVGWNTMTDEYMDKLTEYARGGGQILLSGAHLNYSAKRRGEYIPPCSEKLSALCGVKFSGNTYKTNNGVKFEFTSLEEKHLYPGTTDYICDPLYSAGYVEYMDVELDGAKILARTSEYFGCMGDNARIAIVENKIGKGMVTFVASVNYPGNPALFPLYNDLAREMVSSNARNCEIKVIASDKLRYAVYEGNKMYLLNTDYDLPITVKILYGEKTVTVNLDSLELKTVQL